MSCDGFKVGSRIQAVTEFQIEENLAAPVGANARQIRSGDVGEVTQVRKAGNFHWLIVRWERLNRSLNLDQAQLDLVSVLTGADPG